MLKLKALLLALLVLLVSGTAAFAQPLSDVATYTNWSLANSTNPFTGRKGISHEEASRLPIGTPITLPDNSTHPLKSGEYVWKLNREYARKVPLASRTIQPTAAAKAAPRAEKSQVAKTKPAPIAAAPAPQVVAQKPATKMVDSYALEQARIQARYEADQETARLAVEANNLRMSAEDNLAMTTGSSEAAFAATSKRKAREHAEFASSSAAEARKNATEANRVAAAAEVVASATDSTKARKNAADARADATATAATATKAEATATHAAKAPDLWVWDFGPLLTVLMWIGITLGCVLAYTAVTTLVFRFLPGMFNFACKWGIEKDRWYTVPVKVLAVPALLTADTFIKNKPFLKRHYDYLELGDSAANVASPTDAPTDDDSADTFDDELVAANEGVVVDEERRFSPYPDDKRVELHQALH